MRRNVTRTGVARKQRHHRYQIKAWIDRLPDCPAFIIGNGPSVNDYNLMLLEDYFTIGINRSFQPYLSIDPTILLWQDVSLWNSEYHKLHNSQCLKVARDTADPRRLYYNFHLKSTHFAFQKQTHVLYGRGTSGPLAVQLAYAMGCHPIVLIGLDCTLGRDGRTDFWGTNQYWLPHTLTNCQTGLRAVKEQCPVEIINCGYSDLWPRRELKDVLDEIKPIHARGRQSYVQQILALS